VFDIYDTEGRVVAKKLPQTTQLVKDGLQIQYNKRQYPEQQESKKTI
jgi:hypothetical protein